MPAQHDFHTGLTTRDDVLKISLRGQDYWDHAGNIFCSAREYFFWKCDLPFLHHMLKTQKSVPQQFFYTKYDLSLSSFM